jgi:hypothetical protein
MAVLEDPHENHSRQDAPSSDISEKSQQINVEKAVSFADKVRLYEPIAVPTASGLSRTSSDAKNSIHKLLANARSEGKVFTLDQLGQMHSGIQGEGHEHKVYRTSDGKWVIRVTKPDGKYGPYGLCPAVRGQANSLRISDFYGFTSATVEQYLARLSLANPEVEADSEYLGVLDHGNGDYSIISKQPLYVRKDMTDEERNEFFASQGYLPLDNATYYDQAENRAIFDAHGGNVFIDAKTGKKQAVDVVPVKVEGLLKDVLDERFARLYGPASSTVRAS